MHSVQRKSLIVSLSFLLLRASSLCVWVREVEDNGVVLFFLDLYIFAFFGIESSPLFCFHSMLNRRPSRIEVTPEDRQEEVRVEEDEEED